jgi:hypothetical protein
MRDTLLGTGGSRDEAADAGVSGAAVVGTLPAAAAVAGGSDPEAGCLRGVLAGRLPVGRVSSMASYVHVASWVLQLAHIGRSALHLICPASVSRAKIAPLALPVTDLPPATECACFGRTFASPARRVPVGTAVAHGMQTGSC